MINVTNTVLNTCGDGYWSRAVRAVNITKLDLGYEDDDSEFGELRVHFDTASWDVEELGLIYTDSQFESELCDFLTSIGLDGSDVGYSEQGMQGDDYVSLDVGGKFLTSWREKCAIAV